MEYIQGIVVMWHFETATKMNVKFINSGTPGPVIFLRMFFIYSTKNCVLMLRTFDKCK